MNEYLVQIRETHGGRYNELGLFRARSNIGAIKQAAASISRVNVDVVEIVATVQSKVDDDFPSPPPAICHVL